MLNFFNHTKDVDLSGYTIIIPIISVGNIPQLSVDLLITTYNLQKCSTVWHPAIVPCAGSDPYFSNKTEICTACELYYSEELKIAAIQIRSTIDSKLALKWFEDLKMAIKATKFANILLLSSGFDYEMKVIGGHKFYYITNEDVKEKLEKNNVQPLIPDEMGKYFVNSSGHSIKLYEVLSNDLKTTILIKYASEGDNRPDALMMLEVLLNFIGLDRGKQRSIVWPTSWQFVFGGPPPIGIY